MESEVDQARESVTAKEKKDLITLLIQLIGIATVIAGLFGVSYQKGMILAMRLGNIEGSYELREVFNSAVLGYLHAIKALNIDNFWNVAVSRLIDSPSWLIVLLVMGLIPPTLNRNKEKIKHHIETSTFAFDKAALNTLKSFIWSPIAFVATGLVLIFTTLGVMYSVPFLISIIILPSLLGYVTGDSYIEYAVKSDVCVSVSEEHLKSERLHQCTQMRIKGKKIMGEIMLENDEGYVIRRNSSFLYVSKSGQRCIYSIYEEVKDIEKPEDFAFSDEEIDALCGSESAENWEVKSSTKQGNENGS